MSVKCLSKYRGFIELDLINITNTSQDHLHADQFYRDSPNTAALYLCWITTQSRLNLFILPVHHVDAYNVLFNEFNTSHHKNLFVIVLILFQILISYI